MLTEAGGLPEAESTRQAQESPGGGASGQVSKARSMPRSRLWSRWPGPFLAISRLIHKSTAAFTVTQPPIMA